MAGAQGCASCLRAGRGVTSPSWTAITGQTSLHRC
jgi:hypothetical protein